MILVIIGIFTYFLVAPLGIGVSNSNGGKNKADALGPTMFKAQNRSLFEFDCKKMNSVRSMLEVLFDEHLLNIK